MSSKAAKKLYSYSRKQPLQVTCTFTAQVSVGGTVSNGLEFVVNDGEGQALYYLGEKLPLHWEF